MLNTLLGNDAIRTVFAFLLVLIPAVFLHELGHFIAAKLAGITILEFGIGMPPRILRLFRRNGTDYTLNWLPLGGFVRPLGEDMVRQVGDEALQDDREEARKRGIENPKSVSDVKPLGRIFFMAGGALANFITAFVLFTLIAGMGIPAVTATSFAEPTPELAAAGLQRGDTIIAINGQAFDAASDFVDSFYGSDGQPITLTVRRGEETLNLAFTPTGSVDLTAMHSYPIILGLNADSPASEAGLMENDLVTTFNGTTLDGYEQLQQMTREHLDEPVTLTIWRSGETFDVTLTPRSNPPEGQGAMGIQINNAGYDAAAGLVFLSDNVSRPLTQAIPYSFSRMREVVDSIVGLPARLLSGSANPDEMRLASPLGISQVGGILVQESIERNQPSIILEYMALISFALGLTNLLPIPALDGGRILFVLIEIVRGRPISPEREGMVHLVGMIVLLSLMFVVLINDAINPLSNLIR